MTYITQAELIAQFGADVFEGMLTPQIEQVLVGVDSTINSILTGIYLVPFVSPFPSLIKEIAVDLTRYRLQDANVYDEVKNKGLKERYDYALKTLYQLASGEMTLIENGLDVNALKSAQNLVFYSEQSRGFSGVF